MSTSRFQFDLATEADDAQLRRRMAEDRMNGALSLSFRREPYYFDACHVQGERTQVIKCTDHSTDSIVFMGSRSVRTVFLNARPARAGYLSDLRGHPGYRNGTLLARGYRFLRQLHEADPVPLYYTLILDGNTAALRALVGQRAGLPAYVDFGRILTPGIYLDRSKRQLHEPGLHFERACTHHLPDIFTFVHRWYAEKQFAPLFSLEDFGSRRLRDLQLRDFMLVSRRGRLVGCCAAWDERRFRQTHIERYSPGLSMFRPFYNIGAHLFRLKPLPPPGGIVPCFYLAFVAVEENDPRIFRALLRQVYLDRQGGPWHYFIAGFHERDALAGVLDDYRRIEVAGRLFVVHFEDGENALRALDPTRIPYLEMATI